MCSGRRRAICLSGAEEGGGGWVGGAWWVVGARKCGKGRPNVRLLCARPPGSLYIYTVCPL